MSDNNKKYDVKIETPTSIDAVGFRARRRGDDVRDCLLILEPGHKVRLGLLTRPAMETTVVESVVRGHGGVLGIDGSRVSMSSTDLKQTSRDGDYGGSTPGMFGVGVQMRQPVREDGRFPTNLILKHGSDCYQEGTRKVKGSQLDHYCTDGRLYGKYNSERRTGYTDEDGTEEVPNWVCEPSCPVRILDSQSGVLKSGYLSPEHNVKATTGWSGGSQADRVKQTFESNEGGASRFFKQVTSEDELDSYITTLVRGENPWIGTTTTKSE